MWRKVLVICFIALLLASLVIGVLNYRHQRLLEEKNLSLQYDLGQLAQAWNMDIIDTNVGTTQFLRRGYTVQLESVKYEANGLTLKGYIGNPSWLWISNLTLDFYASRRKSFEDFKKDPSTLGFVAPVDGVWIPVITSQEVGTAQTTPIPSLSPGGRQPFEVTIPNVRQETDYARKSVLSVSFSGERYSYGP